MNHIVLILTSVDSMFDKLLLIIPIRKKKDLNKFQV